MISVICPKCKNQTMIQDTENFGSFTCSKCGEKFGLLPLKPNSKDFPAVWDYLIQAGKHIRNLEKIGKI